MPGAANLDGVRMSVSSMGDGGVADGETQLVFHQRGPRVVFHLLRGRAAFALRTLAWVRADRDEQGG